MSGDVDNRGPGGQQEPASADTDGLVEGWLKMRLAEGRLRVFGPGIGALGTDIRPASSALRGGGLSLCCGEIGGTILITR